MKKLIAGLTLFLMAGAVYAASSCCGLPCCGDCPLC